MWGPWQIGERLGGGGMGEVFAARHAGTGVGAAVKVVRPRLAAESDALDAFDAEIRAIARIGHPHVVRLLDQGIAPDGRRWFAMERAAGTLGRPAGWSELRRALDELLAGLAAAHGASVLHLDIKPSNLLVRADGSHALADFGVAWLADARRGGARFGSVPYMAPERFDGRLSLLTEATDLYAVGCLAYELASGAPPFPGTDWAESGRCHALAEPPPLVPRIPVPAGFEAWIAQCLAKRPGDRYRSAADARSWLCALDDPAVGVGRARPGRDRPTETLAATALGGAPVPVDDLLPIGLAPPVAPVPEAEPEVPSRAREGVGHGLIGLTAVPFAGRGPARAALWTALREVSDGAFRVAVVDGPRGVGRSRLAERFTAVAVAEVGAVALRVRGGEPDAARAAVRRWAGPGVEGVALRLGLPERDPRVARVHDGDVASAAILLSRGRRAVVWVDDALRSPEALEVLASLVAARPAGVLALACLGDLDRGRWADRARSLEARLEELGPESVVRIPLEPLDEADVRRLLADWAGLQPALVGELAERSEGDLGWAIGAVQEGLSAGWLAPGADGLRAVGPVPERLEIGIDRWHLPELAEGPARDAVIRAAAFGASVPDDRWSEVADAGARAEAAERLRARGLIAPVPGGWRWASPVPRRALLEGAPDAARHLRAVADVLPGRPNAWHRGQIRLDAGDFDAGLADLFEGAADAVASGHMARAARWVARVESLLVARAVPRTDPRWGDLWQTSAMIGPTHQGYQACWDAYRAVIEHADRVPDDPAWARNRARAIGGSVWLANVQLLPRRAAPLLELERELARAGHGRLDGLLDDLGWFALTVGRSALAKAAFGRAVEVATERGSARLRVVADASLGVAKRHAGDPDAVEHLERAGRAMLEAGYLSARADLASALGDAERWRGDLDRARGHYEEALRAVAEGEARGDPGFRLGLGLALRAAGDRAGAAEAIRRCRAVLADHGPGWEGSLAVHHATVGGPADLRLALAQLDEAGLVDPDLAASVGLLAGRERDPALRAALRAFADRQERRLAAGRREVVPSDPADASLAVG